jgi:hypothetical protein
MNQTNDQSLIQRHGETPSAWLGDSLLMMNVEQGQYFSLNEVGSRIWELLEKPTTEPALEARLISEYEVTPADCHQQVAAFIDDLRARRLLIDVA